MYAQKYWSMSNRDVLDQLNSSERGLSRKEASERLVRYGVNEISKRKVRAGLFIFLSQFKNPLVIILIGASVVAAFLGELVDACMHHLRRAGLVGIDWRERIIRREKPMRDYVMKQVASEFWPKIAKDWRKISSTIQTKYNKVNPEYQNMLSSK